MAIIGQIFTSSGQKMSSTPLIGDNPCPDGV